MIMTLEMMMKITMIKMRMILLVYNDVENEDDIVGTGKPGAGWPNTPPHFRSYEGEPPFLILPS